MHVTASDLVLAINHLPRNRAYNYVSPKTRTKIEIQDITFPEGPIFIKRYSPSKGGRKTAKIETISIQMLWRIANAFSPGRPINFDRVLGGSYNTRSALEALLAHTPEFFYCYPGRIEILNSSTKIKPGHKHIIWNPDEPHEEGILSKRDAEIVISEIPSEAVYESLTLPEPEKGMDIEVQRRHAQIQIALIMIGLQLGFRVWVAHNDKGIIYNNQKIGEINGVILSLNEEKLLSAYNEAIRAALNIDCIWFRNNRFMPAVFEVEHTTGVTRGLVRMKNYQDALPPFPTRWVIVAPDEDRQKVITEANKPQFKPLMVQFLPYSSVEELYSLCQRRKPKGIMDEFLDCFMEPTIKNTPQITQANG